MFVYIVLIERERHAHEIGKLRSRTEHIKADFIKWGFGLNVYSGFAIVYTQRNYHDRDHIANLAWQPYNISMPNMAD